MALDGNIDRTAKAPDSGSETTVNFTTISAEKPASKPAQVAQTGVVFDRNRGQNQPAAPGQGDRAHPFLGGEAYHAVTGKDAPAQLGPIEPWKNKLPTLQAHRDAEGDKMQGQIQATVGERVHGNAVAVGMGDNIVRNQGLVKNWDYINPSNGFEGFFGNVASTVAIAGAGFGMGQFTSWKKAKDLNADKKEAEPLHQKHRGDVIKLQDKTDLELATVKDDINKTEQKTLLEQKKKFLGEFMDGKHDKLEHLSQFNKDRPTVFNAEERASLKGVADGEAKMQHIADGINKLSNDKTGFRGFYERGKSGMWSGLTYVAGSLLANTTIKYGLHLLPGDHTETDRIFQQNTQESFVQGLVGAAPFRSNSTKLAVGAGAWLTARQEKMTNTESVVTTLGEMALTGVAGALVPSFRGKATKEFAEESSNLLKTPMGKTLMAEAGAWGLGRLVSWTPLGTKIPELQNTSTEAWNSMKKDEDKMTGSTLRTAVSDFEDLGGKWRGVLSAYQRDINGGVKAGTLPEVHGTQDVLQNYHNIITNSRTGLVLDEALGNTVLKAGFTEDTRRDLMGTFRAQSADDKPLPENLVIAPNQGDLDLTSRAGRNLMQSLTFADNAMANMKSAQNNTDDPSAKDISDSDIKAVADEKAKIEKTLREKIFRTAPGSDAHDIKDIVEKSSGFDAKAYQYTLTDYAQHNQHNYDHIVTALEDKAIAARDGWLPDQQKGPNGEISKEYVAKMFRDAAVMRLAWMNYALNTQEGHSTAPTGLSIADMREYMSGSYIGDRLDGPHADRNVDSVVGAANQLDPNNPDMVAIRAEYKRIQDRLSAKDATYRANHGGLDQSHNPAGNPFDVPKPANAN